MKILVVGNSGFIGSFLTSKLVDLDYSVTGLDLNQDSHTDKACKCITGSILNNNDIEKASEGADLIINLAAKHHDFGVSEEEFYQVNIGGTKNILDCANKKNIKKFVFISSVAVYDTKDMPVDESTRLKPSNPYGKSKLEAENLVRKWVEDDLERSAVIVRPAVVFGPGNYANMYNLIDSIYKGKFMFVGKGDNIKSVAYVENLVDAIVFYMDRMKSGLEVFNYSDEPHMKTKEIVKIISKYLKVKVPDFKFPLKPVLGVAGIIDILAKISGRNFLIQAFRIKKFAQDTFYRSPCIRDLGFQQRVSVEDGFKKMVNWYLGIKKIEGRS
jgi:nucleoside-diphosphate-sugar epimerase